MFSCRQGVYLDLFFIFSADPLTQILTKNGGGDFFIQNIIILSLLT